MSLKIRARCHPGPAPTRRAQSSEPSQPTPSSAGKIIVLNGFPGTGKLTILKSLQGYLATERTCLLDNHLLIDPVAAIIPDRSERHHELRRLILAPIFEELAHRAKQGDTILMTACLAADCTKDEAVFQEHLDVARKAQVPIYWVNVYCTCSVLEQRLSSPERQHGSKTKLTDMNALWEILEKNRLLDPLDLGDAGSSLVSHSLDVSGELKDSVKGLLSMITSTSKL